MKMPPTEFDLLKTITIIETTLQSVVQTVKRLDDLNEGTVERKGMKERVALAEHEISEHKKAWLKNEQTLKDMETGLNRTIRELFIELKNEFKGSKGFFQRYQPWTSIIAWVVTLAAGWFVLQLLSGSLIIVKP